MQLHCGAGSEQLCWPLPLIFGVLSSVRTNCCPVWPQAEGGRERESLFQ